MILLVCASRLRKVCCVSGLSDEELAEEEEAEAMALQRQMAEEMAEGAYAAPEREVCYVVQLL